MTMKENQLSDIEIYKSRIEILKRTDALAREMGVMGVYGGEILEAVKGQLGIEGTVWSDEEIILIKNKLNDPQCREELQQQIQRGEITPKQRAKESSWEKQERKRLEEKQWEERELKRMQETASERKVEILAEIQKRKENEEQARATREDRIKQQPEPSPVAFVPLEDWRDQ